jgi:hypothetical protein
LTTTGACPLASLNEIRYNYYPSTVLLYNSRIKTFGKGKLQSKWDGPYIVHSVLSNGAVTIMDVKGDQFMVNGQRLKVYYEPDVVPLHILMSSPWRKSSNIKPMM